LSDKKFEELIYEKRQFVQDLKIEEGYVTGTVNFGVKKLEGAGIIKFNNLLVQASFFKNGDLHGYCITYYEGNPLSIQLYDRGSLIIDTADIISITRGTDLPLPDKKKGKIGKPKSQRKLTGFTR
jgi:antitoxin component YwqK of YwqJK toxin-antitoxin module